MSVRLEASDRSCASPMPTLPARATSDSGHPGRARLERPRGRDWAASLPHRTRRAPRRHRQGAEPSEPAVDAARLRARRVQEEGLAALLADGAWPPGDAAAQAAAITGALRAALVGPAAAARMGPRADPHAQAETLVTFVLGAVGARLL